MAVVAEENEGVHALENIGTKLRKTGKNERTKRNVQTKNQSKNTIDPYKRPRVSSD